jgi:hypothetical protein
MIMADVLKILLLIVGTLAVYIGYWLAAQSLFPAMVERSREQYRARPVGITLLGFVVLVPLLLIGLFLGKAGHPLPKLLGLCCSVPPLVLGLVGAAGLAQLIGLGLPSSLDEQQPWRRTSRGGIVLCLTFLLPVFGWFILMPWAVVSGLGAFVLSAGRRSVLTPAVPPLIPTGAAAA